MILNKIDIKYWRVYKIMFNYIINISQIIYGCIHGIYGFSTLASWCDLLIMILNTDVFINYKIMFNYINTIYFK